MLEILWYFILIFFVLGYSILDGIDLGIGILMPFLSRNDNDRQVLLNSIKPFWDGYEVWLIIAGGTLLAISPISYGVILSGFYILVITLLIALILRAVSIEFWVPESPQRKLWEVLLPASSFFIISILCIMLGNLLSGLHLDTDYNYTGGLSGLFKPFTLGLVVMGITAVCMQGVTYASLQVAGSLEERVRQVGLRVLVLNIIAFVIFSIFLFSFVHGAISSVAVWIGIGVTFMSIILIARAVFSEYESTAFIMSSVSIIGLWVIIGGAQFPNFVRSTEDQSKCLTIYNAMNTHATLNNMLYFVIPAILAVVLFTIWIHKVIKVSVRGGKRKIESE